MKRSILLFGCLVLLGAPDVAKALAFAPVVITLDMPNQSLTAPGSGVTTLDFTGTISIAPGWVPFAPLVDSPHNNSQTNSLVATVDPAVAIGLFTSPNYTGSLFTVDVPAGTSPDLYAYEFMSSNPSVFSVLAFQTSQANGAVSIDGAGPFFTGTAAFSVQVNGPATGVPDQGSTLLLMGASIAVLGLGRRVVRPVS